FVPSDENAGVVVRNCTEIEFTGGEQSLVANLQFPNEQRVYYYEVRLDSLPEGTNVAVGVAMRGYPPLRMAGWASNSVGYHTADGTAYYAHPLHACRKALGAASTSDTIGVGWRPYSGKMFFAINGAIVCHIRTPWAHKRMYPVVSADGPCSLNVNVGARAFVLSHGNMRHWGLASTEGSRPPPPMYQNVHDTVLLAATPHADHAHPPSYENSVDGDSAKHTALSIDNDDFGDLDDEEVEEFDSPGLFGSSHDSRGHLLEGTSPELAASQRRNSIGSLALSPRPEGFRRNSTPNAIASLYAKTTELIRLAVAADAQHRYSEALGHYNTALKSIAELQGEATAQQRSAIETKFCEYSERASRLLRQLSNNPAYYSDLDRAHTALEAAHQQHASGNTDAALNLYISGIGCYQRILRQEKSAPGSTAAAKYWRRELHKFASTCLKEAEHAKQMAAVAVPVRSVPSSDSTYSQSPTLTVSEYEPQSALQSQMSGLSLQSARDLSTDSHDTGLLGTPGSRRSSAHFPGHARGLGSVSSNSSSVSSMSNVHSLHDSASNYNNSPPDPGANGSAAERLTAEETEVVRTTSHINGLTFLPWLENDSSEKFTAQDYFTDKDGLLTLSPKQQRKLWQWRRASHLYGCPQIFGQQGCGHIVQETVTDCSFVAALCVSVEYERRFGKQLITQHMYPQSRSGAPAFNPAGKYMVKLFVNGLWRRVIIDDLLPVAENGKLLCTYSIMSDIGQCLMEKAFLKVMGGYDFPGSNASTDLHVLTGWIPEHIFVQDQAFDAGRTWARMHDGLQRGDVLLTIATGEMSSDLAGALGLVPSHAYAVLDVRQVCGHRLLMVKNPWSSLRWTGKFSHADQTRWTPELRRQLGYDPTEAENNDQGIFWIDFESV
ncbi:cysteine protease, partial [Coemansia sp. Cherry 401B]